MGDGVNKKAGAQAQGLVKAGDEGRAKMENQTMAWAKENKGKSQDLGTGLMVLTDGEKTVQFRDSVNDRGDTTGKRLTMAKEVEKKQLQVVAAGMDPNGNEGKAAPPVVDGQGQASATQMAGQMAQRKIIRNGQMEFEVDSFDSSFMLIS